MILAVALVAGCNKPGPGFRGIEANRITIGKSVFDVRVDGTRAQAIRLNREWAPRLATVAPRMVRAIEQVSGCKVKKLGGDQAVGIARLDCGQATPGVPGIPYELDCEFYEIGDGYGEMRCRPDL